MSWNGYVTYTSWIYGGRYVSVLAEYKSLVEIVEAIKGYVDEEGKVAEGCPLVHLSMMPLTQDSQQQYFQGLLDADEGIITLHIT